VFALERAEVGARVSCFTYSDCHWSSPGGTTRLHLRHSNRGRWEIGQGLSSTLPPQFLWVMRLLWPCRLRLVGGRQPPSWEAPNSLRAAVCDSAGGSIRSDYPWAAPHPFYCSTSSRSRGPTWPNWRRGKFL